MSQRSLRMTAQMMIVKIHVQRKTRAGERMPTRQRTRTIVDIEETFPISTSLLMNPSFPNAKGRGAAELLDVRIQYVARMNRPWASILGNSWLLTTLPYLIYSETMIGGHPAHVTRVKSLRGKTDFFRSGPEYVGENGTLQNLSVSGSDYVVTAPDGARNYFYGPATTPTALRGKLKKIVHTSGVECVAAYGLAQRIRSLTAVIPGSDDSAVLLFESHNTGPHAGRIHTIEKRISRAGVEQSVKRWRYTYHTGEDDAGLLNDLKTASTEAFDDATQTWHELSSNYYRYYKDTSDTGFPHGLRYVVSGADYARMKMDGLDPAVEPMIPDQKVAMYATSHREYDGSRRVSKMEKFAGKVKSEFVRIDSDGEVNWTRRSVEEREDGSTLTTYFNSLNQPILRVLQKDGESWPTSYGYDSETHKLVMEAGPDAISSFTMPTDPSVDVIVSLHSYGYVRGWEYYPLWGGGPGAAPGRLKRRWIKAGGAGLTETTLEERTYLFHTVNGFDIYMPKTVTVFRDAVEGGPSSNPATTTYEWQWHSGLAAPLQKLTRLPIVPLEENGPGGGYTIVIERYDTFGNSTWLRDEAGVLRYSVWDRLAGALVRRIEDVNIARMDPAVVPSGGWTTPAGGGLHLISDFQNDSQGRWTLELGPEHHLDLRGQLVNARRARYRVHLDSRRQLWEAEGYAVGDGFRTLGAARIIQRNESGLVTDVISVSVPEDERMDSSDPMPQSRWTRWTRTIHNEAGRKMAVRRYVRIPQSEREVDGHPVEGFEGMDYLQEIHGYDSMERPNRVVSPGGTIERLVYDPRGLVLEKWVGTNDMGATDDDPSGDGAAGNNMRCVEINTWDDGGSGQPGSIIEQRRPVNNTPGDDLVTTYEYDLRRRQIKASTHDGRFLLIDVTSWDNLDQPLSTTRYKNWVATENRLAHSETFYDPLGRVWRSRQYGVNADGSLAAALTEENWYDPRGLLIKSTQPQQGGVYHKTVYDTLRRVKTAYLAYPQSGGLGGNSNSVASDIVLEQTGNTWDAAGNLILVTQRQRFDDASGTGDLNGPASAQPRARVIYQALWQDGIGRAIASADYGTNGGVALMRPDLIPEGSDTVLVSRTRYGGDGEASETTAPDGSRTRWENDRLGRRVKLIENAQKGHHAPGDDSRSRVTQYQYAPDGGLCRLIVSNPGTGDQVTEWRYGVTLENDGVARTDLLKAKLHPLDVDATGQILRQTTHSYDRQGRVIRTQDANGTTHEFVLDKLGRVIHDRATALGAGTDAAVRRISLDYNARGLMEKAGSHNNAAVGTGSLLNQVTFAYDAFNQLAEDAQSHSGAVTGSTPKVIYTHADGSANTTRRLTITYPSGKLLSMSYGAANSADDRLSRLAGVTLDGEGQPLGEFAWMGAGRLVSLTLPQPGIALSYKQAAGGPAGDAGDPCTGYDRFGRTVDMRWIKTSDNSSLSRIQYGYDRMNRRLWRQDLAAPADTRQDRFYGYDGLGQVTDSALGNLNINRTAIAGVPSQREAFDYDSIGNWKHYLRQAEGATTLDQSRWHNRDNQLTALDEEAAGLAYDAAGNMTACRPDKDGDWTKGCKLEWDAWNRLVSVRNAQSNAPIATYAYDGLTRRITSATGGTARHFYYNDAWKCVEERLGSATTPERVHYWSGRKGHRDELLRRDRASTGGALDETLWCLMDYFDPIAIADSSGAVQERYSYSAFGLASILTPAYTPRASSSHAWNFLFHGQFRDVETGWDNYGYRYYLPWLGRWLSRDPIGEIGGINLYTFVANAILNRVDYLGRQPLDVDTRLNPNGSQYRDPNTGLIAPRPPYHNNPNMTPPNGPPPENPAGTPTTPAGAAANGVDLASRYFRAGIIEGFVSKGKNHCMEELKKEKKCEGCCDILLYINYHPNGDPAHVSYGGAMLQSGTCEERSASPHGPEISHGHSGGLVRAIGPQDIVHPDGSVTSTEWNMYRSQNVKQTVKR